MTALRLVVFDVDGTLVDSQGTIVSSMCNAFEAGGLSAPSRNDILKTVGLSLDEGMAALAPDLDVRTKKDIIARYKANYMSARLQQGTQATSPLFEGARSVLDHLKAQPGTLIGVATGKSKRGMDKLIEGHGLQGYFVTQQVADFHPSKPNPSMLVEAMSDVGVSKEQTVMIGDTSFDMDMAQAAGTRAIGVTWGYHSASRLGNADKVIEHVKDLMSAIEEVMG